MGQMELGLVMNISDIKVLNNKDASEKAAMNGQQISCCGLDHSVCISWFTCPVIMFVSHHTFVTPVSLLCPAVIDKYIEKEPALLAVSALEAWIPSVPD